MGIPHPTYRAFFIFRRKGAQPKFDIAQIAAELMESQDGDAERPVLFEWSEVLSWPFAAPSAAAVRGWAKNAPPVSRAAFVHDQRWNRHAAILAALLRAANAQVRSFRPSDYDKAIQWLERGQNRTSDRGMPNGHQRVD
jgi:hypothetical protein